MENQQPPYRMDIAMVGGGFFNFEALHTSDIRITDIAHALSHVCRFAGHTREFYSVAQHSVLCSINCAPGFEYAALMHDIAEYVLGDVTKPLKRLLPDYQRLEKAVEAHLLNHFELPSELPVEVKEIDLIMLATEKRDLMPDQSGEWPCIKHYQPHSKKVRSWTPEMAFNMFMTRFNSVAPVHLRAAWQPKILTK